MNLTVMAWRNLWRRKRRTLITCFSIGFGVMLSVTFTGMGDYAYSNMINAGASMGMGHVTVEALGYNEKPALDKRLVDAKQIREKVLRMKGVKDAMTRITGQAMFASANKTVGGLFVAIDPAQESQVNNLYIRSLVEGKLFPNAGGRGVVIGARMADKLKVRVGKKLVYTTTDVNGEIVSEIARVTGIFKTGVNEMDGALVLLPINSVRRTLNYGDNDATLVAILINDHRYAIDMRDQIKLLAGGEQREVLSWQETQPELVSLITMDKSGNYVSQILIGFLIAAGILNTILMAVLERTREFGVMMAVGMSPSTLFRLVIIESFWLAIVGLLIGVIITVPWYIYLHYVGLDFSGAIGNDYSAAGVLIDPVMRIRLYGESILAILAGVFSLTMVAGLYPAWRAGHVPPVESLKTI